MDTHERTAGDHGDSRLQMHFDTPVQQFDSSKLGMWIFLGTELLMFGGLFCAYAVYRGNHPEIFAWGSKLLDRQLGAINTLVLITSSFTMAAAVSAAQRGWRWRQVALLFLTLLGACGFLVIKAMEYRPKFEHGLVWGSGFRPDMHYVEAHWRGHDAGHGPEEAEPAEQEAAVSAPAAVDLDRGRKIAYQTCASCHGADLRGMPKNGKDMLTSEFIRNKSDDELLAFLKVGRSPWDPENTTQVQMPPRGGNPTLDDDKLRDVIAFLRLAQESVAAAEADGGADAELAAVLGPPPGEDGAFLPRSVIPPAAQAPSGLVVDALPATSPVPPPPPNAHRFFSVYFLMTGLHAVHVVAGMAIIVWLMLGAALGRYGPAYFTPVDLGGLFWHLVDLIWIFLFPLFYLI
ncbi:MAG TPA: cytochrome c oxidase subunit 3 [bacterium]|nr:cytochrome c oxidase subunit 3 [bacterium]